MALEPLGTSQAPLNECSESQSARRNSPWPWTPAPWHPLTYIFTQLLFLRTETKKKKKMQSPTAQQSWMEGLEGSAGFPPRREAGWGGRGSHLRESVHLSPPSWPHPPRHSWFSQTQEGQGRFLVFFHQRNREACGAIKWPKITPREKACLRPRTRGGLSTCFLWEEIMKRKWIQSGR